MNNPPPDVELSRLLSLTSHEIRNPLSTLMGYISLVVRDTSVSERHREWLQTALNSCSRLRDVGEQVSSYAKMIGGEIKINRNPVDLGAVLKEVVQGLPPYTERDITVEVATASTSPIVQADATWLKRALTAIVTALRLEVGANNKLYVQQDDGVYLGKPAAWIFIGDDSQIDVLRQQPKDALGWFDDKERGNLGLTLWIAKWVLNAHGGGLWAPATAGKGGGGIVALPHA